MSKSFLKFLFLGSLMRIFIILLSQQFTLIGLDSDVYGFYERVKNFNWSNFELFGNNDSNPFVVWNYILFEIFGYKMWIGQLFCLLMWIFSFILFYLSLRSINLNKLHLSKIFGLYCFLPSSLIYTSAFLRESYQMFFVNLFIYCYINFKKQSFFIIRLLLAIFSTYILILLHFSFISLIISFVIILICLTLSYYFKSRFNGYFAILVVLVPMLLIPKFELMEYYILIKQNDAISIENSRAFYANLNSDFNPFLRFFQYLFEPFPFRNLAFIDLVIILENSIRFILLFLIMRGVIRDSSKPNLGINLLIFYLYIEYFWSVFTYNWGTAIRHHLPVWGLILLVYVVCQKKESKFGY